jgi:hypothetical protein
VIKGWIASTATDPEHVDHQGWKLPLAAAAIALFVRARRARWLTWRAYWFALVGTLFGLTVALLRGLRGADIWVHVVMLAGLAGGFALLSSARPGPLGGPAAPEPAAPERDGDRS